MTPVFGWYGDGHMSGWDWVGMTAGWVVLLALLASGIALLVRSTGRTQYGPGPQERPSAEQVLAERFARGEIDEDEYRRRLATLRGTDAVPR